MNDNSEPPAAVRWRALANDSYAVAHGMTDPEARMVMHQIALGYDRLALHAEQRETSPVAAPSNAEPEPGAA